jgi:TRAP-type uncharacterized transport system substrate-binding protein
MNRSLSIISEIPANKAGIELFANALVDGLMSGDVDPLEIRAKIDAIEKIIKAVKANEQFRDVVLDAADLHNEKSFEVNGIKFTKAESARYDYSSDKVWNQLKAAETNAANERKVRESILSALKEPTEINGVMCNPPVKISSTTVRVTF